MVISNLSTQLIAVIDGLSRLQLKYVFEYKYFVIPLYFHGMQGYYLFFDPWTGKEIPGTYRLYSRYGRRLGINRMSWKLEIERSHIDHINSWCQSLSWFMKGGEEEGLTSIIHIPNIRTYAILNKKEYGGFEPMDYCPFCGFKFPPRLDDELTEMLQKEYSLDSWKDYKKAPHEFYTDGWWKTRKL